MPFKWYIWANNAVGTLSLSISSSTTSIVLDSWQWDLFPSSFPYLITLEQLSWETVEKREIVEVTNRAWDTLTVVRAAWTCPIDDTTTSQTQVALAFNAWSSIRMYATAEHQNDLVTEMNTKLSIADYQNGTRIYWATSTWNDDYAITLDPTPSGYVSWAIYRFKADVDNTWAATLNVNSLWAVTIKKKNDQDLVNGDIEAWQIVTVAYDGTNFQMQSQVALDTVAVTDNLQREFTSWEAFALWAALYQDSADWKVYNTDATDTTKLQFIGIAQSAATGADETIVVKMEGVDSTQSWLTIWDNLYLADTPWDLSTVSWSNTVFVWVAISSTQFRIVSWYKDITNNSNKKSVQLTSLTSSWTGRTVAHWLWRKPEFVSVFWSVKSTWTNIAWSGHSSWWFDWTNNFCNYNYNEDDAWTLRAYAWFSSSVCVHLSEDIFNPNVRITITSVDETNITYDVVRSAAVAWRSPSFIAYAIVE